MEVKLFGRAGQQALPGGGVVTAKAGSVTEVPLSGVPAGQYTVSATSDVSIVAAARVSRGLKTSQSLDFAWSPATDQLGSQHVVPLPQGGERLLVFGALDDRATISYTPITADGKLRTAATADIAAGTTTTLKAADRIGNSAVVGYLVSASGGAAYGTVLLEREGRNDVSTVAIAPGAEGQEKVPVDAGLLRADVRCLVAPAVYRIQGFRGHAEHFGGVLHHDVMHQVLEFLLDRACLLHHAAVQRDDGALVLGGRGVGSPGARVRRRPASCSRFGGISSTANRTPSSGLPQMSWSRWAESMTRSSNRSERRPVAGERGQQQFAAQAAAVPVPPALPRSSGQREPAAGVAWERPGQPTGP